MISSARAMHTEATRSVCGLARLSHENKSSAIAVYTNLDLRGSVVVVSLSCRYRLHCYHKNDTITTRHIVTAQNDKTTTRHIVTALCRWDVVLVSSNCRVVVVSFCVVTMKIVGISLGYRSRVVRLYDRKNQIHLIFFRELSNRFEVSFENGVEYST